VNKRQIKKAAKKGEVRLVTIMRDGFDEWPDLPATSPKFVVNSEDEIPEGVDRSMFVVAQHLPETEPEPKSEP
jgi:hypothetical protein